MSYKTILVHADLSRHLAARVRTASHIAGTDANVHVIGIAMSGVSHFLRHSLTPEQKEDGGAARRDHDIDNLYGEARSALESFESAARDSAIRSFESKLVDDESLSGLSWYARYSDLVIVTQPDPNEPGSPMYDDLPEYVAVNGGRPVLVLPYGQKYATYGDKPLLAWDGSLEATRALHHALPLLTRAGMVQVVIFSHGRRQAQLADAAGTEISQYLGYHGIRAELHMEQPGADIGNALLARCHALGADLLVIGCYGHSRFQEMLLGGVTQSVLQVLSVPLLMVH